jgi:hypothetical protein
MVLYLCNFVAPVQSKAYKPCRFGCVMCFRDESSLAKSIRSSPFCAGLFALQGLESQMKITQPLCPHACAG